MSLQVVQPLTHLCTCNVCIETSLVTKSKQSKQSEFIAGIRITLPLLLAVIPFGLIAGITGVNVGLTPLQSLAASVWIFAGAAQIAAFQLFADGAPLFIICLVIFIINIRHLMYSASIGLYTKKLKLWVKALFAYLMTDQAFAIGLARYQQNDTSPYKQYYYFGTAITIWFVWVASATIGIVVGTQVPASWSLDFIVPLMFMALAIPTIQSKAKLAAAITAAVAVMLFQSLPFNLALIIAAVLGISVGLISESYFDKQELGRQEVTHES